MRLPSTLGRVLWLLGVLALCAAQSPQTRFPPGTFQNRAAIDGVGVVTYAGPGDIVAGAKAWWGLRAYSLTYATGLGKIANVCIPADVACADLNSDSSGNLVIPTIGGSSCAVVTCTIQTLYDQSGGTNCSSAACDVTNSNATLRPTLVVNCIGSKPCMQCTTNALSGLTVASFDNFTQPNTISGVVMRTAVGGVFGVILGTPTDITVFGFDNSANNYNVYAGANQIVSAADNAFHATQWVVNGASSDLYIDGSSNSISSGADSASGGLQMCGMPSFSSPLTGQITEVGIWNAAFSGGNKSSMNSNQHSYWGF